MRLPIIAALVSGAVLLAACDKKEECTQEVAQAKSAELITKIQELATSNPEKLAALAPKMAELQEKAAAAADDPEAACALIDELGAELAK